MTLLYNGTPDGARELSMSVGNVTGIKDKRAAALAVQKTIDSNNALVQKLEAFNNGTAQDNAAKLVPTPMADTTAESTLEDHTKLVPKSLDGETINPTTDANQPDSEIQPFAAETPTSSIYVEEQNVPTDKEPDQHDGQVPSGNIFDDPNSAPTQIANNTASTEIVPAKEISIEPPVTQKFVSQTQPNIPQTPSTPVTDSSDIGVEPEPEVEAKPLIDGYGEVLLMYQIKVSDTTYGVSQTLGVPVEELLRFNGLLPDTKLEAGKILLLPKGKNVVYPYEMRLQGEIINRVLKVYASGLKDRDISYDPLNGIGEGFEK